MTKLTVPLALAVLAACLAGCQSTLGTSNFDAAAELENLSSQSYPAPSITCPVIDENGATGETVSLSDYAGKVVIMTQWASWSSFSTDAMPVWDQLKQEFGDNVVIMAINVGDMESGAAEFVASHDYDFVWCLSSSQVDPKFASLDVPLDTVVDRNGMVVWSMEGLVLSKMHDTYYDILTVLTE